MSKSHVGQELRLIRKHIGITQAGMADRLQISQSAYEKYERGERRVPKHRLERVRALKVAHDADTEAVPNLTAATTAAEPAGKPDRFERWIQGCWTLFVISAVWLVVRITALELNTEFLRLGPNDEALGLAFLLFVGLTILLANETWRRACHGLPIRNQRRAA